MNRIREARKKAGLKQTDLCVRLGISQSALSGWENGKYEPDNAGWLTLSQCLNVSIDYLMGVSDEPSNQKEASASKCNNLRKEAIILFDSLSESAKDQALSYLRFLAKEKNSC